MNRENELRIRRFARRLEELRLWRNAREHSIDLWLASTGDGERREVALGEVWPETEDPVLFSTTAAVPESWGGEAVELELWLGGEGLVRLSTGFVGGLNPFHRSFPVTDEARGGERIEIEAEVVSKGLFGARVAEPRVERSSLVVPEKEVRALERDLSVVVEACQSLDEHEVIPPLLDVVDRAFATLTPHWPSETQEAAARYLRGFENPLGNSILSIPSFAANKALDVNRLGRGLWSTPAGLQPLEPLPLEAREAASEARRLLAASLEEIKAEHPPVGRLALTGHAHLDLAWLWPLSETRRKGRRTFSSVLLLMDRYRDFRFNQSSAQLYEWIERDAPDLFERVRERVDEGRWEPVGGSWTEPDCQMPGGESIVRQLLYGQRYFGEKFGRRSSVAWLPDTFGFSPAIPQLLRGAGMDGFFTYKLNWSETNRFPHDLFLWEGLDGTVVTAHCFDNPGEDYNGDVVPHDLLGTWRNFQDKHLHRESLFSFGWGDGGGGPSAQMLENYARLKDFPALPRLRMSRVDEFFATLPREGIPKWVGELYLELHRGTLTSQALVKKLNREAEHRLLEAEAFATAASIWGAQYPREELEAAWKTLLLNQFHDILPGTSISEVCQESRAQLEAVVRAACELRDRALGALSDGAEDSITVANPSLGDRTLSVVLPREIASEAGVTGPGGESVPSQRVAEGLLIHAPDLKVPSAGWKTLRSGKGDAHGEISYPVRSWKAGDEVLLENGLLRVEVGEDGTLGRVYDRQERREVLDGRANQIFAYADKPREWEAWDIDADYEREAKEVAGVEEVEILEDGPLRAAVRVSRRFRNSTITQTYRLLFGSRRLDIVTDIEWRERQVLLRALFPLAIRSHEAVFETMFGVVRRPTHRNTPWEAARFEVPAHRFLDLSETGYGAALLNDGKYGHSVRDNVVGISLLRSPLYPDPFADEGHHGFTYSLLPHPGDWVEAEVARKAFELNSPLVGVRGRIQRGSFCVHDEGVELMLGSLKRAEDGNGAILRVYEPHGARGDCTLRFPAGLRHARRVNLLEEPAEESEEESLDVVGDAVRFRVRPFEVLSLRVEFENDQ